MAGLFCCSFLSRKAREPRHSQVSAAPPPPKDVSELRAGSQHGEDAEVVELRGIPTTSDAPENHDTDQLPSPAGDNGGRVLSQQSTLVPTETTVSSVAEYPQAKIYPKEIQQRLLVLKQDQVQTVLDPHLGKYDGVLRELRTQFVARGMESKMARLEPVLITINNFVAGLSVIAQAIDHFQVGQLVWGSVALVISLGLRLANTIDPIFQCFEDLTKFLPRLENFKNLYPTHGVKAALDDIGVCVGEFLLTVAGFLSKSMAYNMLRLLWSSLDHDLQKIRERIERRRRDFNEAVALAHMESVSDFQDRVENSNAISAGNAELFETLKKLVTESVGLQVQVPCRIIPFTTNPRFFPRKKIRAKLEAGLDPTNLKPAKGLKAFLLYGLGGSGKTQLAMDFVSSHWEDYDVILWVGADNEQTLAEGFLEAASTLGVIKEGDPATVRKALKRWLSGTEFRWLLVFDNADEPERIIDYWPRAMNGSILVTSRVPMLDMNLITASCEVESMDDDEGADMLLSILGDTVDRTSKANMDVARRISHELDGIALAISQMAGFMLKTHIELKKFLELYVNKDEAEVLNAGNTSLDNFQYRFTLASVWKMSYERLSTDAYNLLRLTAFFYPDQIPEALFIVGNVISGSPRPKKREDESTVLAFKSYSSFNMAISGLLGESLLRRNAAKSSFSVHRQIQSNVFGQMRIGTKQDLQVAFVTAVEMLYRVFPRQSPLGEPIPDWPSCELYTKHVLFLLDRYQEYEVLQDLPEALLLLTEVFCDCGVYLWARGRLPDSEKLALASIETAEKILTPYDCLRAQPYTLLGCVYLRSENRLNDAGVALRKALEIRQENLRIEYNEKDKEPPLDVDIQLANAYSNLGIQQKQAGAYEEAAKLHNMSLNIKHKYPTEDMDFLLALSYSNLGKVRVLQGDMEEAARLFRLSVNTMQRQGEEMLARKANFMLDEAETDERLGNTNSARVTFLEAVKILKRTVGEGLYTGYACYRFGSFMYRQQQYDGALLMVQNAVTIFTHSYVPSDAKLACSWFLLSLIQSKLGKDSEAADHENKAAEKFQRATGRPVSSRGEDAWHEYEELFIKAVLID